ncbi:MAG: hypothetical protein JTJ11_09515 [Collinsella sp.]|nr:hypothetical protein [Collinsella sp.]
MSTNNEEDVVVADGGFFDMLRQIERKVLTEMDTPDSRESLRLIEEEDAEVDVKYREAEEAYLNGDGD